MTPSNAGSRQGLIIWAVIASVVGFGSLIWATISFTQANKAQEDLRTLQQQYGEVVDRSGLTSADVSTLKDVRGDAERGFAPTARLLDVSVQRTNALAALIAGAGATDDKKVVRDATEAMTAAKTAAGEGATIATDSLLSAIRSSGEHIAKLNGDVAKLTADLDAARKAEQAALTEKGTLVAALNASAVELQKKSEESQADAATYRGTADQQVAKLQGDLAASKEELIKNNQDLTNRLNELQKQLTGEKRTGDDLKAQLARYRVPTNQIISQADGQITRTPGNDRVFINLGKGNQIAAGMTFEVYDKLGVPSVTSKEPEADKLLKGKASIEVISAQPGISECRVVRLSPGATITEGDPIVNVVYDKNVKFNFYVFGKYNLDYRGESTDRDAEIVKRLISGWGATVTDKLDTKTDFVILGEEPVVPNYTQDELAREPEKAYQKEQAEQALTQFNAVRDQANALNIPILNQTRFLYMIGYYEEAAR